MAEIDAKVNMSLDEIIKLDRKEKKKKVNTPAGKKTGPKKNMKRTTATAAALATRATPRNGVKTRDNFKKNLRINNKMTNATTTKRSQAWRLQRRQTNGGFVGKRYKQQNGVIKRSQSGTNLNKIGKQQQLQQQLGQRQQGNKNIGFTGVRRNLKNPKNNKVGGALIRSRSRSNIAAIGAKNFIANSRGIKRTNSLPDLRDPLSVHNRLGYQSPAQVAYRNRVKRAKQLLLQRQNQKLIPNERMARRPAKTLTPLQQRAIERRQQHSLTTQRPFNSGGLRSDQIMRSQRRAQYTQKLMRMNAARMNPHPSVNFMCTLGEEYNLSRQRPMLSPQGPNRGNRRMSRERSPFRPSPQGRNAMARGALFPRQRSRSRSRSRSRTRPTNLLQAGANVDDRSFSEVMYSVSNNLGVTGRTLNDRFSY